MIHVQCPSCGRALEMPDAAAGSQRTCPHCQADVSVPAVPADVSALDERLQAKIRDRNRSRAPQPVQIDPERAERQRRKKVLYAREGVPLAAAEKPVAWATAWSPFSAAGMAETTMRFAVRTRPGKWRFFGRDNWVLNPPTELVAAPGDLRLERPGHKHPMVFFVRWDQMSELENRLAEDGSFKARFLDGDSSALLRVQVTSGDVGALIRLFGALPSSASARRCPHCGGPLVGKVCELCGVKAGRFNRAKGLKLMGLGALLTMAGIGVGVLQVVLTGRFGGCITLTFMAATLTPGIGLLGAGLRTLLTGRSR